jgi:hypothetical protein
MLNVTSEQQQRIWGADGTLLWSDAQYLASTAVMQVAAATTGPGLGELIQWDETNSVIPRPETTAAGGTPTADLPMSIALFCTKSPAVAASVNCIGVAQQPIAAGKRGTVALEGSIVGVKCLVAALAIGKTVQSSATAGQVEVGAPSATGLNVIVGHVLKVNTVASPGTGLTTFAGIIIRGGSAAVS